MVTLDRREPSDPAESAALVEARKKLTVNLVGSLVILDWDHCTAMKVKGRRERVRNLCKMSCTKIHFDYSSCLQNNQIYVKKWVLGTLVPGKLCNMVQYGAEYFIKSILSIDSKQHKIVVNGWGYVICMTTQNLISRSNSQQDLQLRLQKMLPIHKFRCHEFIFQIFLSAWQALN